MSRHISEQYNTELESVRRRFMEMGGMVEQQLKDACRALVSHDVELAEKVRKADRDVNRREVSIDEQCIHIIARRQPAASDLRLLVTLMKASTDLERIGDEADRIAKMATLIADMDYPDDQYNDIRHLQGLVEKMLTGALDAMARLDVASALAQHAADEEVDNEYNATIKRKVAAMTERSVLVEHGLSTIWAARALERIGDHAKNIAEYVVYLVKGTDVRHVPRSQLPDVHDASLNVRSAGPETR